MPRRRNSNHYCLCTCGRWQKTATLGAAFYTPSTALHLSRAILKYNAVSLPSLSLAPPLSPALKYNTVSLPTLSAPPLLSRNVLRLILPIPYCTLSQKLVAYAKRSCAVNVKSCSSGGTAWRRKIFRNSRINGAPLTVFEFESIVIACICVGVCVVI